MSDQEKPRLGHTNYLSNPNPNTLISRDPNDGLPRHMSIFGLEESEAPKLTPERFVCMRAEGREQCKYYRRQLVPFESDRSKNDMERYCLKLRDEAGEIISLKNSEVLACELREPRDLTTEHLLDEHDARIMERHKEAAEEAFNPLAELETDNG